MAKATQKMVELIHRIDRSMTSPKALPPPILELTGMSGFAFRRFLNSVCQYPDTRFLELGSFKGASICSASYGNKEGKFLGVDNFSMFGGREDVMKLKNIKTFNFDFVDGDHWDSHTKKQVQEWIAKNGKFNIYYYDGEHSEQHQKDAITFWADCLEDDFIYIVDDWNWENVRSGTIDGFKAIQAKIGFYTAPIASPVIITRDNQSVRKKQPEEECVTIADQGGWWNGCGIFVINQSKDKEVALV